MLEKLKRWWFGGADIDSGSGVLFVSFQKSAPARAGAWLNRNQTILSLAIGAAGLLVAIASLMHGH
ncbi:MAG TPA: hypothetical protein VHV77_03900 [Pirellulales bacterium]|nr:hypothetical protein [Pirellulales bacterium]